MPETLYIRLRDPAREDPSYAIVDAAAPASISVSSAPVAEILSQAPGRKLILLAPAGEVRLTRIRVPSRQTAKVLQAAPFLLEDQLAEDPEHLHYALGPRQSTGDYPVALVDHDDMERWLAPLKAAGVTADAVVPESLCLPLPTETAWHVLIEPQQAVVRHGAYAAYSCTPGDLPYYLKLAGEDAADQGLRILVTREAGIDYGSLERKVELLPGYADPLEALIRHYQPRQAINLLQGPYSRNENLARLWRPWRLPAALVAGILLTIVVTNGVQAWRLGHAASAQHAANVARFHRLFPDEPASLALSLAMQQEEMELTKGGKHGGILPMLQQVALGLKAAKGLKVSDIQYRDGSMYVDLTGSQLQPLEKLRDWFKTHHGAHLEVQTANSSGGSVQIRIKLSAA